MWRRIGFSSLIAALLFELPTIARADSFAYTFSSNVAHFSFTEPSLLTTDQTLSILPLKLQGATFVNASVAFFTNGGQNEACFLFGTANVTGNCNTAAITSPFSEFDAEFLNATSVGTYLSFGAGCARSDLGEPCIIPSTPWKLTISHGSPVPEPSSFVLFGSGALGLLGVIRRKLRS
jgi:hypothetical protein